MGIEALNENIGYWETTWFKFSILHLTVLIWWDTASISTLALCLLLYALCVCYTLHSRSLMLPNHHAPPNIAFLLLINLLSK